MGDLSLTVHVLGVHSFEVWQREAELVTRLFKRPNEALASSMKGCHGHRNAASRVADCHGKPIIADGRRREQIRP